MRSATDYTRLALQLEALFENETDLIANAANTAALIFHGLEDVSWVGFYFLKGRQLVLGPFQGRSACVRIPLGKGVCGSAAEQRKTLIVPDVHRFPGHIACDAAARSEIVVPLMRDTTLMGVLDLDSHEHARFDAADARGLEQLAAIFVRRWPD